MSKQKSLARLYCEKYYACSEGLEWFENRTQDEFWRDCKRADWMLFYVTRESLQPDEHTSLILLVADLVEPVVVKYWPDDGSAPRMAIDTARGVAVGHVSPDAAYTAARAARAVGLSTYYDAAYTAASAAYSAGHVANAAVGFAERSYRAVAHTVSAIDSSAAAAIEHRRMCDVIRTTWPTCEFAHLRKNKELPSRD